MVVVRLGRAGGARFAGDAIHVLIGLAMVIACVLVAVYLTLGNPGCSAKDAMELGITTLR